MSKRRKIKYSLEDIKNHQQAILKRLNVEESTLLSAYQSLLANSFRIAEGEPESRKLSSKKHLSWKKYQHTYQNSIQRQTRGKRLLGTSGFSCFR